MGQRDSHGGKFKDAGTDDNDPEHLEDSSSDKSECEDTESRPDEGRCFFLFHDVLKAQFANVLARGEPGSRRSG